MKTASELGLEDWELEGLVKTLAFLEGEAPGPVQKPETGNYFCTGRRAPARFDMRHSVKEFDCGTAMCIGGYAWFFGKGYQPRDDQSLSVTIDMSDAIHRYVLSSVDRGALSGLYFPEEVFAGGSKVPGREAAVATLRRYLETGETRW